MQMGKCANKRTAALEICINAHQQICTLSHYEEKVLAKFW